MGGRMAAADFRQWPLDDDHPALAPYIATWAPLTDGLADWPSYHRFAAHLATVAPTYGLQRIVDLGCLFGVQALCFPEFAYLGVDCAPPPGALPGGAHRPIPFFTHPALSTAYWVGRFPDAAPPVQPGDCFIANLFGYDTLGAPDAPQVAAALARYQSGFLHGPAWMHTACDAVFATRVVIWDQTWAVGLPGFRRGYRSQGVWYADPVAV